MLDTLSLAGDKGNCRGGGLQHSRWDPCQLPSWVAPRTDREPQLLACGDPRVRGMSRHWKCFRELRSEKSTDTHFREKHRSSHYWSRADRKTTWLRKRSTAPAVHRCCEWKLAARKSPGCAWRDCPQRILRYCENLRASWLVSWYSGFHEDLPR